jgi:hypothetical protein
MDTDTNIDTDTDTDIDTQVADVINQVISHINHINNNTESDTTNTDSDTTNTDSDTTNENDTCIYEPIQYNYLWKSSCMFLVTTCYTVYQAKYEFIVFPAGVFLTSINYWRKPVYNSWQRSLDVFYVYFSIFYNMFRSLGAKYMYQFNSFVLLGLLFYILSNYNQRQKRLYMSALLHSIVHLLGNVALIYLYSGEILTMGYNPAVRGIRDICENMVE